MPWNRFEQDKEKLKSQYTNIMWNEASGLSSDELKQECSAICEKMCDSSKILVKAKLVECVLEKAQISVNPYDWFQAKLNHGSVITNIRASWIKEVEANEMKALADENLQATINGAYTGLYDFSHVTPDWNNIISLGVVGILKNVEEAKKTAESQEQKDFYEACVIAYNALIRYIKRMADEAETLSDSNPKMVLVAQSLINITKASPQNMLEAMQLMYIFYYVQTWIEGENVRSLGGLDSLLYKFYIKDLNMGKYSKENLRELIDYFYYELYAVGANSNSPFYLCGKNDDGIHHINELTYVLFEEYVKCNVHDPKVHIRYSKELPDDFIKMVLKAIIAGNNSIVFMNDDVAISSLENLGISNKDALNYVPVGCYEPAVMGKEVPCSCAGKINLLKAVELVMNNGEDSITGKKVLDNVGFIESFEEFYFAIKETLKFFVERTMEIINGYEKSYMQINPSPLMSATMDECVNQGKDAYAGGAKYNNTSISVFGIADIVDSVISVKKTVFQDKIMSYDNFCSVVNNDWNNHELLRVKCKNTYPKYGNGNKEVDEIMTDLVEYICSLINNKPNARGGVYRCGFFSINWYQYFGQHTGSTPCGRKSGDWLSKNMSPGIGNDKNGITALINSVTKIDYTKIPDGTVLDLMLHLSAVKGEEGAEALYGILKTYIKEGGMAIQFNVLNPETLRDAQLKPELYPNLQVRLCGWNVYFVNLSKEEQNEFIQKCEHSEG